MRVTFFYISLILLISIGFSDETKVKIDIQGKWKAVSVTDLITGIDSCPPIEEKDAYIITFMQDSFAGRTARNEFWGKCSISVSNKFSVYDFLTTKVTETWWGIRYINPFAQLEEDSISISGNSLSLYYRDQSKLNYIRHETGLLNASAGLPDKDIILYINNSIKNISIPFDFPIKKSRLMFFHVSGKRIATIPFQIKKNWIFVSPEYVSPGVYFITIEAGNTYLSRKLIIHK